MDQTARDVAFRAYVETALWSSIDSRHFEDPETYPEMLDASFDGDDIHPESLSKMRQELDDFIDANSADLETLADPGQVGHDFWLTRNRHGAGFWDRGLGELGDRLTDAAHAYGDSDLYVGDDGKVHVS